MNIAVFGATGMAGSAITAEATHRGHRVLAISRHPGRHTPYELLTPLTVDIRDATALDLVLAQVDAAVLAVRLPPGEESQLAPLTHEFLSVAARHHTRVLIIGGAAPLRSPHHPERFVVDDPNYVPAAWKQIANASLEQFRACAAHTYGSWTYLSPPAIFEPFQRTGSYRRGTTTLLTDKNGLSRISAPDLAIAAVDELEHPGQDQHFTVVHDAADQNPRAE